MSEENKESYYDVLGLSRHATAAEVKRAYHDLARIFHPDSNYYDEIISEELNSLQMDKFKRITAAYSTLGDSEKRKIYDESLPPELQGWDSNSSNREQYLQGKRVSERTEGKFGACRPKTPSATLGEIDDLGTMAQFISLRMRILMRLRYWLRI